MKVIKGDLLQMAEDDEFDAIVHGCNCFNAMGKGIALSIKNRWPEVYAADCKTTKGGRNKLGTYSFAIRCIDFRPSVLYAQSNPFTHSVKAIAAMYNSIKFIIFCHLKQVSFDYFHINPFLH
jgi:hypothetical protein